MRDPVLNQHLQGVFSGLYDLMQGDEVLLAGIDITGARQRLPYTQGQWLRVHQPPKEIHAPSDRGTTDPAPGAGADTPQAPRARLHLTEASKAALGAPAPSPATPAAASSVVVESLPPEAWEHRTEPSPQDVSTTGDEEVVARAS